MANINWRKFTEEFKFVKTHNKGNKVDHSKHDKLIITHNLRDQVTTNIILQSFANSGIMVKWSKKKMMERKELQRKKLSEKLWEI